jgi:hypothetical protein
VLHATAPVKVRIIESHPLENDNHLNFDPTSGRYLRRSHTDHEG